MQTNTDFLSYFVQFVLQGEMFQAKVVEDFKRHILRSTTYFRKLCPLIGKVENIVDRAGHRRQFGPWALHAGNRSL
jgi:hypothetical protein